MVELKAAGPASVKYHLRYWKDGKVDSMYTVWRDTDTPFTNMTEMMRCLCGQGLCQFRRDSKLVSFMWTDLTIFER